MLDFETSVRTLQTRLLADYSIIPLPFSKAWKVRIAKLKAENKKFKAKIMEAKTLTTHIEKNAKKKG